MTAAVRDTNLQTLGRTDIMALSTLISFYLILSYKYRHFTLDDAYITLRYSNHLAEGYGPLWNIGMDPVEGYTSTLWMLLGAIPHYLGLPPFQTMKILGVVFGILMIVIYYYTSISLNMNQYIIISFSSILALNPALAFHGVMGMETTLGMLLALLAGIAYFELVEQYDRYWAIFMYISLFLTMLTRPGTVIFAGVFLILFVCLLLVQNRRDEIITHIKLGFVLNFIPGMAFLISRKIYFGHFLPNPFYVKSGSGLVSIAGIMNSFGFVWLQLGPIIFITLVILHYEKPTSQIIKSIPIFGGIAAFIVLWSFIEPKQGFLWRFQMPMLPVLLLAVSYLLSATDVDIISKSWFNLDNLDSQQSVQLLIMVLLLSGTFVFPLHTYDDVKPITDRQTSWDRAEMGRTLAPLADEDYRMFVTESGGLPYYSDWTAIDNWGLNDEYIARNGPQPEHISEFNPDVVMILKPVKLNMFDPSNEYSRFLDSNTYRLVAVVPRQKQNGKTAFNRYHLYFVNKDSSGYRDISCEILSNPKLTYSDREAVIQLSNIDIKESEIERSDC